MVAIEIESSYSLKLPKISLPGMSFNADGEVFSHEASLDGVDAHVLQGRGEHL